MRQITQLFFFLTLFCLLNAENIIAQELPGIIKNTVQYKGNNSQDPNDISGMPEQRIKTPEETQLLNEIKQLRETNDRNNLNRILELENQLDLINPNSVSKPAEYYDGGVGRGTDESSAFSPEAIGNVKIFDSGSKFVSSIATATEQIGSTAGRIWVAFSVRTSAARDTIRVFYSDDNGANWTYYAYAWLGGTDQINFDEMDMEIIENTTGEKYVWMVYGFRNDAGGGRWRAGGFVLQTPTFAGNLFAFSWPGDDDTKRYYRPRITSDNSWYPSLAYTYVVASFDSAGVSGRVNTQKTLRCTNPYTTTPTFSYKADKFWWFSQTDFNQRDLHSDIAFFKNSSDSIIVSFSNVPDSTKIFFAKSDISNGPASATGAGGFIGGNAPNDHKQFARLSSNGNDNGSIICVFRQNTNSVWRISYYRTTNFGNFNSMNQAALQGSATSNSYQPEIVGVRNKPKHYFAWRLDGSPDSLRLIGTNNLGFWDQNIAMMNSQTALSGVQGPKPGFRNVDNDSCFVVYPITGPYDVWAAYGCSGMPTIVDDEDIKPVNYSLSQNYPNPFNPSTTIKYSIPSSSLVKIKLFNMLGQEISELVNQEQESGDYEITFDAANLPSGVYFYTIEASNFAQTRKMVLLK
jgi:hypothetical protein